MNIIKVIPEIAQIMQARYDIIKVSSDDSVKNFLYFLFKNEEIFIERGGFISVILAFIANGFIIKNMTQKELQSEDHNILYVTHNINWAHIAFNSVFLIIWLFYFVIFKFSFIQGNN